MTAMLLVLGGIVLLEQMRVTRRTGETPTFFGFVTAGALNRVAVVADGNPANALGDGYTAMNTFIGAGVR